MVGRGVAVCAAVLALSAPASGNPMDHYGLGSRGAAMANTGAAVADDWTASYYNPAGMARGRQSFGFGFLSTFDDVHIKPMGRGRPTDSVEPVAGFSLGVSHPMGTDNFRGGLAVYLPLQRYQRANSAFIDEREGYPAFSNALRFEFYGDREQRQVIIPSIAYRFASWLIAGIGVSVLNETVATTSVYFSTMSFTMPEALNLTNDTAYTFAPVYGLASGIGEDLVIAASYRAQISFPIHNRTTITMQKLRLPSQQVLEILANYTPAQCTVGSSYRGIRDLLLTADVVWFGWSGFRDTHSEVPPVRLHDVIVPRFGAETRWDPWIFRTGYSFEPSPVPHQGGRTNIVDNDAHILSLGAARRIPGEGPQSSIGAFLAARYLAPRRETKRAVNNDDPAAPHDADPSTPEIENPGYPGWTSNGMIYSVGLDVSVIF